MTHTPPPHPAARASSRSRSIVSLATVVLAACAAPTDSGAVDSAAPVGPRKTHLLSIVGYNYTDQVIDHFEVNGRGGGNLGLSTPTSGGQGDTCCVSWTDGSRLPVTVKVTWVAAYCMQRRTNSAMETRDWREPLLKTSDIEFVGPVPPNPTNFEVHFYPDGHVEAAITETTSSARLKLPVTSNGYRPGKEILANPDCAASYERVKAFATPTKVDAKTGKPLQ
jgi:hypothetical protein